MDRSSGKPIGIFWTGRYPKSAVAQSSARLSQISGTDDPAIWTELNYAVPASKIREYMARLLEEGSLSEDNLATIQAIIGQSMDAGAR